MRGVLPRVRLVVQRLLSSPHSPSAPSPIPTSSSLATGSGRGSYSILDFATRAPRGNWPRQQDYLSGFHASAYSLLSPPPPATSHTHGAPRIQPTLVTRASICHVAYGNVSSVTRVNEIPVAPRQVDFQLFGSAARKPWQLLQGERRGFASKLKKTKIKSYSSYKRRFKLLASGEYKRWRPGKRHNAKLKTPKQRRQLRRPSIVSPGLKRAMRKLNFG